MSFTPINKNNLNKELESDSREAVANCNTEMNKKGPNTIVDSKEAFNVNIMNNTGNPIFGNNTNITNNNNNNHNNKNSIFHNFINSSELNQNKFNNFNAIKPDMPNSSCNYDENSRVKFDEIISNMNNYIDQYIKFGLYSNALFYSEKVFFLTLKREEEIISNLGRNYNPIYKLSEQLFNFANCLFFNKEYFRCVNLIQKNNMTYFNIKYLNLIGQALFASEDYESVIQYLDKTSFQFIESILIFFSLF